MELIGIRRKNKDTSEGRVNGLAWSARMMKLKSGTGRELF